MILTVTPNPCVDKTVFIDDLKVGTFIRSQKCTCIPGGKGANVSRAINALGGPTMAMVIVGGHPGAHVVDMIHEQDGLQCIPIWVESQTRTITTVLEEPIHRQTAFFEPGSRVTDDEMAKLVETFEAIVPDAEVVTFNGTVPDPAIKNLYRELIRIAKDKGVATILDAHGPEFALGVDSVPYMVKPNVAELEELLDTPLDTEQAKWDALAVLHERGVELAVLSLGKNGAFVLRGADRLHVVPPAIEEVNPVGSGDALVAGFALGIFEDMDLDDMAVLAVAAGAANAMSWDIGHFNKAEVEQLKGKVRVERLA